MIRTWLVQRSLFAHPQFSQTSGAIAKAWSVFTSRPRWPGSRGLKGHDDQEMVAQCTQYFFHTPQKYTVIS